MRILELTQDVNSSTKEIVNAIKSDPVMSAKILKAANSTYFGCRAEIKTLEHAVTIIGRSALTTLALSFSLSDETVRDEQLASHFLRYWLQSIVQAAAAETLAMQHDPKLASEWFMAGLLVDLGQLALLKLLKDKYVPILEGDDPLPLHLRETQSIGMSHIEVGVRLMEQWRLPAPIIEATRWHHCDADVLLANAPQPPIVWSIAMAAAVGDYFCGHCPSVSLQRIQMLARARFGEAGFDVPAYLRATDQRRQQAAKMLLTETTDLPDFEDLMAQAQEQVARNSIEQAAESQRAAAQQQQSEDELAQLRLQNQDLRDQALNDRLTGLYNRRFFEETLLGSMHRACRSRSRVAVLFVDVDHFKRVNDTFGHSAGDSVLREVADVLQANIRGSDVVARYGGEEFIILMHDADEAGTALVAERIRAGVEKLEVRIGGKEIRVTVSIGAVTAIPRINDQDLGGRLIELADAAMYESKRHGRNQVTLKPLSEELANDSERCLDNATDSESAVNAG